MGGDDQRQVERAMARIANAESKRDLVAGRLHRLVAGFSGRELFAYRGSNRLRLILSFEGDACTIEDIVDHDKLNRLPGLRWVR